MKKMSYRCIQWILLAILTMAAHSASAFYNPQVGRWLSRDPITEHGGLNLYEYVGNNPIGRIDPLGLDYILLNRSWGFHGFGHSGSLVGNPIDGYNYYSKDGAQQPKDDVTAPFPSIDDFWKSKYGKQYNRSVDVPTTAQQDQAMNGYAAQHLHDKFHHIGNNCHDFANNIMKAGGITPPPGFAPNDQFHNLRDRIEGPVLPQPSPIASEYNGYFGSVGLGQ